MSDDRGLAALAERLKVEVPAFLDVEVPAFLDIAMGNTIRDEFAAAVLGERGVFLPDGRKDWLEESLDAEAEIARLREIEAAARDVDNLAPVESAMRRGNWTEDGVQAMAALRAALAAKP